MLVSLSLFVLSLTNENGVIKSNNYLLLLIPFFILRVYFLRKDKKIKISFDRTMFLKTTSKF